MDMMARNVPRLHSFGKRFPSPLGKL